VVAALLDVRRQRGPPEDDAHLLGDGTEPMVRELERDRIGGAHRSSTSPPRGSTCTRQPGGTTVVALYSHTTAGPRRAQPTGRSSRRKPAVAARRPSNQTRRTPSGAGRRAGRRGSRGIAVPPPRARSLTVTTSSGRAASAWPKRSRWSAWNAP